MGHDAVILYETDDGEPADFLWIEESLKQEDGRYMVDICVRYWCPTYRNGDWPNLLRIISDLFHSTNVTSVWYGGDDLGEPKRMTIKRTVEYTEEYLL